MAPKKTAAAEPQTVVPPADVDAAVDAAAPAPVAEGVKFEALIEKLTAITNASKDLISQVRLLQKEFQRLQKEKAKIEQQSAKIVSKKDKKAKAEGAAKRSPSGFAKPTKLSDELCAFLKVPSGTELARTEVTRMLNAYIKEHQLQDPADKRKILPNTELQGILAPGEVTYFNLQSKLKHHFFKA
jgi:chromatin remodeling complex protein RSC6